MAVREQQPIELDLERVDALIQDEEAKLEPKHRASLEYRAVAERTVAGGVASSWQDSPPHAIFIDHGKGNRIWDLDGNEYLDFHLGYGAMVAGHAHPKIVEAVEKQVRLGTHFAQPTKGLDAVGENLVDRFKLPLWRFCNSGTEATLEAARLMRATTGRNTIIKIEGTYHGHHDALMFSVAPDPDLIGPREHPVTYAGIACSAIAAPHPSARTWCTRFSCSYTSFVRTSVRHAREAAIVSGFPLNVPAMSYSPRTTGP